MNNHLQNYKTFSLEIRLISIEYSKYLKGAHDCNWFNCLEYILQKVPIIGR